MNLCLRSSFIGLLLAVAASMRAQETNNAVLARHAQDLVVLQNDKLVPFKADGFFKAPYTILYFSAGWCTDCRRFSPALVSVYDRQPEGVRQFEVLLLSMDKSEDGMLKYMRSEKMKWPALAFDKTRRAEDLKKYYSGQGIPCLSVINAKGKLLLQSKSDQDAAEVLKQFEDLLKARSRHPQPIPFPRLVTLNHST